MQADWKNGIAVFSAVAKMYIVFHFFFIYIDIP